MKHYDVVIVGSGVAGMTALIWLKHLGMSSLMLEQNNKIGGQLNQVHNHITDYPGLYGLTGLELIDRLRKQLKQVSCEWRTETRVTSIDVHQERIILTVLSPSKKKEYLSAGYVIVATGACERKLGIPGEDKLLTKTGPLSTSRDIHVFENKDVVIVGGGDRALEGADRIKDVASSVLLIHRSDRFKAKQKYLKPVLESRRVTIKTFAELQEIVWNKKIEEIRIRDRRSGVTERYQADMVLIRIGVESNSSLIQDYVELKSGVVQTDSYGETKTKRIFAVGDIATSPEYSSIGLSVGQGIKTAKRIWLAMQK